MAMTMRGFSLSESFANFPSSTERLTLLPENAEHGGILAEGTQVSNHFSATVPESWPPTAVEPPTKDAIEWKRFYLSHSGPDGKKSVVGIAGFGMWSPEKKTAQVGAALVPEYLGKRLGEEIVAALGKWALSQPQFDSVVCDVPADHPSSAKSLERAGYVKSQEAPAPGHLRFVMTRSAQQSTVPSIPC